MSAPTSAPRPASGSCEAPMSAAPAPVQVVAPFGDLGGSERWLLALLGTGHIDAEVALLAGGPFGDALHAAGIPVTVRDTGRRPLDVAGAGLWLARLLRSRRPPVV